MIGQWNVHPGFLRLFAWTKDFNPNNLKQTNTHCWVRILGLPQEYWRPKIIFSIAGGIGILICIDETTSNRSMFGHFARVLVDIDLNSHLHNQILVERDGYVFFFGLEYEKLPTFCSSCQFIGHDLSSCKKNNKDVSLIEHRDQKARNMNRKSAAIYVPKQKEVFVADGTLNYENPENVAGVLSFQMRMGGNIYQVMLQMLLALLCR